jgi:hypothetical protein
MRQVTAGGVSTSAFFLLQNAAVLTSNKLHTGTNATGGAEKRDLLQHQTAVNYTYRLVIRLLGYIYNRTSNGKVLVLDKWQRKRK